MKVTNFYSKEIFSQSINLFTQQIFLCKHFQLLWIKHQIRQSPLLHCAYILIERSKLHVILQNLKGKWARGYPKMGRWLLQLYCLGKVSMERWHLNLCLNNYGTARVCRECVRQREEQMQRTKTQDECCVLRATGGRCAWTFGDSRLAQNVLA